MILFQQRGWNIDTNTWEIPSLPTVPRFHRDNVKLSPTHHFGRFLIWSVSVGSRNGFTGSQVCVFRGEEREMRTLRGRGKWWRWGACEKTSKERAGNIILPREGRVAVEECAERHGQWAMAYRRWLTRLSPTSPDGVWHSAVAGRPRPSPYATCNARQCIQQATG
jgi:hypothetical protein